MDNNDVVRVPFLPLKLGSLLLADVIRKYTSNQESIGDYPSPGLLVNYVDRMVWLILGGMSKVHVKRLGLLLITLARKKTPKYGNKLRMHLKAPLNFLMRLRKTPH